MKNFTPKDDLEIPSAFDGSHLNLFSSTLQEKLLDIYWIKKDLENILKLHTENISDDLTDVCQLLSIIEAQTIRILKLAATSDAEFIEYWGFH